MEPMDLPHFANKQAIPNPETKQENKNHLIKASTNIWSQDGETFWPGNTSKNVKVIPPAIYSWAVTPTGAWYLEKSSSNYVFPYKIYGNNDAIIGRIQKAWANLDSNIGVLLNGLKGTGKTITAQQIVNWAISEGIMVLNVQGPIPLADVMEKIEQPLLVLFDEFEKTHDEQRNPGCQQHLLSAIDGLSRNKFRRLFLFTTNTKKLNENFVDRPSRIRYSWEFSRISNDVIELVMDDLLKPKLKHLKTEIMSYLNTREILTMDVVKTIIIECNTFEEGPESFKQFVNLTEKEPGSFKLEIIDDFGSAKEITAYFKSPQGSWISSYLTKAGRENFITTYCQRNRTQSIISNSGHTIDFIGPTDKDNEWICHVQIPIYKAWIGEQVRKECGWDYLWLDEQPENWKLPEWARKKEAKIELTENDEIAFDTWLNTCTVFGSGKKRKVRVRFTVNEQSYNYDYKTYSLI